MRLEVLLPSGVFSDESDVTGIVAETASGSFGLLPHRLDCVAALVPGILSVRTGQGEAFIAIDEGVLVKTGPEVRVSVRRALHGTDLAALREAVQQQFDTQDEAEMTLRSALRRVEGGLLNSFAGFANE